MRFTSVWEFLSSVLKNLGIIDFPYKNADRKEIDQDDPLTIKWRYIWTGIAIVLSFPIIYQKSLGSLRYVSALIVAVISYTIIVTVAEFPLFFNHYYKKDDNYIVHWLSKPYSSSWWQGWATMMLSYYGHLLFFFMRGELMNKTEKRMNKLINILTSLLIVFFCCFSVIGYLSVGEKYVPNLFTLRKDIGRLA